MKINNKKANIIAEAMIILGVIIIFAIAGLISVKLQNDLNADIQNDTSLSDESKAYAQMRTDNQPLIVDNALLFIICGLTLAAMVAAWFIDTSPWFVVVAILLLVMVLIAAAIIANAYEELASDDDLISAADQLPKINFIMSHIIEIIIGISILIGGILYGKS